MDNFRWIFLHKCILEWEWYKDINTKGLFIHCLLKANYSDKEWKGKLIKRGQFFTSTENLANELNLSIKQIRTSLKKLEKTKELGIQGASNGTMITVCKYESYQNIDAIKGQAKGQAKGKQRASKRQQLNKEEEITNNKKENNNNREDFNFENISSVTWFKWTDFKKSQFKFSYKTIESEQIAINELIKLSFNDAVIADKIVNQSIAQGWKGLFELKEKNKTNGQPPSSNFHPASKVPADGIIPPEMLIFKR